MYHIGMALIDTRFDAPCILENIKRTKQGKTLYIVKYQNETKKFRSYYPSTFETYFLPTGIGTNIVYVDFVLKRRIAS